MQGSFGGNGAVRPVVMNDAREADVVWRVEQHLNVSGDSVLQMRGWVQPASRQDARAAQLGLEAGRAQAAPGEARAALQAAVGPLAAGLVPQESHFAPQPPAEAAAEAPAAQAAPSG